MRIKSLCLLAAIVAVPVQAAAQITLEPNANSVISLEASKTGMTRIANRQIDHLAARGVHVQQRPKARPRVFR